MATIRHRKRESVPIQQARDTNRRNETRQNDVGWFYNAYPVSKAFILIALSLSIASVYIREARFANVSHQVSDITSLDVVSIPNFLSAEQHLEMRQLLENLDSEQSYRATISFNRKGSSFSHLTMPEAIFNTVAEPFLSTAGLGQIRSSLGARVNFVPRTDPNHLSVIYYNKPGDHHSMHYDGNNYHGHRWAGIYTVKNENNSTGLPSSSQFQYEHPETHRIETIQVEPNTLVLFQGDQVKHGVTQATPGDERIVVSMVLCDVCERKTTPFLILYQMIVNLVFYGTL